MKKISYVRSFCLILLGTFLISGCAKPPVTDTTDASSKPMANVEKESLDNKTNTPDDTQTGIKTATPNTTFVRIHFAYDQSTLTDESRKILAANAMILKTEPAMKLAIEGHCDSRGSDEYNIALGARRAQVVKDYLVSLGVTQDRLETISYGEEMPADMSMNEQAWAKNRRAEFKVLN